MFLTYGVCFLLLIAATNALQCNYCTDDNCSKTTAYICDKNAVINTYSVFYSAYMVDYKEPVVNSKTKYECLSLITTFVDGDFKDFDFKYKGCIIKGFEGCSHPLNRMYHRKENRKHCKICSKDYCNKNSSSLLKSSLGLIAFVVVISKVFSF